MVLPALPDTCCALDTCWRNTVSKEQCVWLRAHMLVSVYDYAMLYLNTKNTKVAIFRHSFAWQQRHSKYMNIMYSWQTGRLSGHRQCTQYVQLYVYSRSQNLCNAFRRREHVAGVQTDTYKTWLCNLNMFLFIFCICYWQCIECYVCIFGTVGSCVYYSTHICVTYILYLCIYAGIYCKMKCHWTNAQESTSNTVYCEICCIVSVINIQNSRIRRARRKSHFVEKRQHIPEHSVR